MIPGVLVALALALATQSRTIAVAWDANTDGVTVGYRVTWGPVGGTDRHTVDVGPVTTWQIDVPDAGNYQFAVSALDKNGIEGPPSEWVCSAGCPSSSGWKPSGPSQVIIKGHVG